MSVNISERSRSRGRALQYSGRGGTGNIRSPSQDPVVGGPDDYSDTRGREPIPTRYPDEIRVTPTGRSRAGNIRSPSRDVLPSPMRSEQRRRRGYDQDLIAPEIDIQHDTDVHTSGRGGTGNLVRSRPSSESWSRSRSREPVHHSGRGGTGNIYPGEPTERDIMEVDETERAAHRHVPARGVHSTDCGGYANITPEVPYREAAVHPHGADHPHATHAHDHESTGRGGAAPREDTLDPSSGLAGLFAYKL
ncbi:hypothetical protein BJV78DRAFT_1282647 [Lactifluus subvellereus]|nr:hypothetical protein BJV78DRAFT_1282647 [Lactifluus subvellereus]